MRTLRLSAPLLAVAVLPGCYVESADCTPSTTTAKPADKVDVRAATSSAVVEARLTADGAPLSGRRLTFEILDDGATVYETTATTGSTGTARADLKRADAQALVALARADQFRASFGGDGTYCSSSDEAQFRTVNP